MLKFYKGPISSYNSTTHGDGLYLTTDTYEIIYDGKSYSRKGRIVNSITGISVGSEGLHIKYLNGTEEILPIAGGSSTGFTYFEDTDSLSLGANSQANGQSSVASGTSSAVGTFSNASGDQTVASGESSHSEGYMTTASAKTAHAEGYQAVAGGLYSHAEGLWTVTSGVAEHAQGKYNISHSGAIHSIGIGNSESTRTNAMTILNTGDVYIKGIGNYSGTTLKGASTLQSVVDGIQGGYTYNDQSKSVTFQYDEGDSSLNSADADYSFVIGFNNKAHRQGALQAGNSFVGGDNCNAYHSNSFVFGQGLFTVIGNQTILGKYNKGLSHWNDKPVLELGFGSSDSSRSTLFLVNASGWSASLGGFAQNNIGDFAEYFEWFDGNPDYEDRIGYMVQANGDKIEIAENLENCIGVITGTAAFVADSGYLEWHDRFLRDEWGRCIYEINEDGERVKIENPNYDNTKEYIPREQRKEWSPVGLLGKVLTRQDGTLKVGGYAGCKNGVATDSDRGYKVLKVISDDIALLLVK